MVSVLSGLKEDLTRLRDLLARGDVKQARALLKGLERRGIPHAGQAAAVEIMKVVQTARCAGASIA